ncbi:hypothetical protein [Streptomyces chartreusis]|uniref:hypothetical protein n=1 Tax=Streptomyces chartreusis TaxID=1969 RepID=UPI0037A1DF0F
MTPATFLECVIDFTYADDDQDHERSHERGAKTKRPFNAGPQWGPLNMTRRRSCPEAIDSGWVPFSQQNGGVVAELVPLGAQQVLDETAQGFRCVVSCPHSTP